MSLPAGDTAKKRALSIYRKLKTLYPDARCGLAFANPFELYVATVLSAQCTDERVNKVTPALFAAFPNPPALAGADPQQVEELVRSTGFFRNKAKNIQAGSQVICDSFSGKVPDNMENLLKVAGVGRKTANVILGNCFDVPGITVDTHVRRLSQRLELTTLNDPVKIERDLMALIPQKGWTLFSHTMISHGRQICGSRKPNCEECGLRKICNYQHS